MTREGGTFRRLMSGEPSSLALAQVKVVVPQQLRGAAESHFQSEPRREKRSGKRLWVKDWGSAAESPHAAAWSHTLGRWSRAPACLEKSF